MKKVHAMNNRYNKCFHYLKKNPGSGFILVFMFLLAVCAFLLIHRREKIAEQVANWAYLSLVIGVIIKFVRMIREKK